MIKAAIVDDDSVSLDLICSYLERFSKENNMEIVFSRFEEAISFLEQSHSFDLVFLDIEMPLINGMQAAEKLRETNKSIALIFVTNTAKYAVNGYSVDAVDYLLKPVNYTRFSALMKKTVRMLGKAVENDITLRTVGGMRRVRLSTVICVEIKEHLLVWNTENGRIETWGTLKDAEKMLPQDRFVRCSHNCIIGLKYVDIVDGDYAVLYDGRRISISHSKRKTFMTRLLQEGGGK